MSNRLVHEQSPYLLQHAENPVDWFPWGEEAHTLARDLDKPIFLSIGYAACHWCHVMEQECFTNKEVADLLNRYVIPIKVDREERPEIDRIYMTACQLMTGSGGWPLSLFLTPDLKPFFAATYIPRRSMQGKPGMLEIIPYLADIWQNHRDEVYRAGEKVLDALGGIMQAEQEADHQKVIAEKIVHTAYRTLVTMFDPVYGGFGRAPKFPSVPQLQFLLRYWHAFSEEKAREMVLATLRAMARGGIRDQIGYGFHRYATDQAWRIPHFEKMLYDQAMNAIIFARAWEISKDSEMKAASLDCLRYMTDTLQRTGGGFACAEDADSPDGEGAFYLWKTDELMNILSPGELQTAREIWGIKDTGNIRAGAGIPPGENIPYLSLHPAARQESEESSEELFAEIREIRRKLFQSRENRLKPLLDDKILADWNGLAIEGIATVAMILHEDQLIPYAEKAAGFLLSSLVKTDGTLSHRWRNGQAGIEATAQDYFFSASGLVTLFQATGTITYLRSAVQITDTAISLFTDHKKGGFYATREGDPAVPVRLRDDIDGPVPSVTGHAYQILRRLALITGRERYRDLADNLEAGMTLTCRNSPLGTLSLLGETVGKNKEVRAVITGLPGDARRKELWCILTGSGIQDLVIIPVLPEEGKSAGDLIPDAELVLRDPVPSVWLCERGTCRPPVTGADNLRSVLDSITRS